MGSFGKTSALRLATCHTDLQKVANAAILIYDFSIAQGHREEAEQAQAVATGHSLTMQSRHVLTPAEAFDAWPYMPELRMSLSGDPTQIQAIARLTGKPLAQVAAWVRERYFHMAGVIVATGAHLGIKIRHGGDWNSDGDGNLFDNVRLDDLPHFELVR